MEKCFTLKGQSLENRLSCIFQARGNIVSQGAEPAGLSTGNNAQGLELQG